jgi:hypothetical protein
MFNNHSQNEHPPTLRGTGTLLRRSPLGEEASKEFTMKIVTIAALALVAGMTGAFAQDVIITSEQDTVIREYVQKKPLASISVPGVELNIGSSLPETVEVRRFEEVPDVNYEYVVIDNRTVLVEPGTRRIVKVYD